MLHYYYMVEIGPPPLYLVFSEYYKKFGVVTNLCFPLCLKFISQCMSPFTTPLLKVFFSM